MNRKVSVLSCSVASLCLLAGSTASAQQAGYLYRVFEADGTARELAPRGTETHSVARRWAETLLQSIRKDRARPTVHARNLYHTSAAMWDAWAAFDAEADQVIHQEKMSAKDIQAAREEAISYAACRILLHRFQNSVGAAISIPLINATMVDLGYDPQNTSTVGNTPSALGNRIAASVIAFGLADGSNEQNGFANQYYSNFNPPIFPELPGNPDMIDPNRWQPVAIDFFIDQSGNPVPLGSVTHLTPEWGILPGFGLSLDNATLHPRDGFDYPVHHDPGDPPYYNGVGDEYYRWGNELVVTWSSHLDPADGVMMDISPATLGNSPLPGVNDWAQYYDRLNGSDWSQGHAINPATGLPYAPQVVPRGDYARILAEFWADGPDSETPPGHWFSILNYINDHPMFEKRFMGQGPVLDDLEWDVKAYLMIGGSMHDVAVTAWGCKGAYDYVRPISAIRYMADRGQSSDPNGPSYHPGGIRLIPDFIEVVTDESCAPGQRHEHLKGDVGKVAIKAWRGPVYISDPDKDVAGVDWILAENWWPYQRPTFVTPPFAGYVSGHSTFSRNASEMMTMLTGSNFFPGGMGEFHCPQNEYLHFEVGPSMDITLQWATYQDASDQTSLSRIWGGIHPPADDLPGRHMGFAVAQDAFRMGLRYFNGNADCLGDMNGDGVLDLLDIVGFVQGFGAQTLATDLAQPYGVWDLDDLLAFVIAFSGGCP